MKYHIRGLSQSRKCVVSSFLGGMLEFFEFTVFGFLSPILIPLFFEEEYQTYTSFFFVFAISFLARPFGGILFGYMGDKLGRKFSLNLSLITMAISTFCIGCLPDINAVGPIATLLLIFLRIIQGISAGGEFPGGIIFSIEHSPSKSRAFVSSLVGTGSMVGLLLGNIVSQLVINNEHADVLWRLPFLASIIISVVCFYIRKQLVESEEFIKSSANPSKKNPALNESITHIARGIVLSSVGGMICYFNTFYLSSNIELVRYSILATLCLIIFPPICAWMADRYLGKKNSMTFSLMAMVLLLPIILLFSSNLGIVITTSVYVIFLISSAFYLGPMHAVILGEFGTRIRYRGYALSYNIGMGVIGGSTPFIVSLSRDLTGSYLFFILMFLGACIFSLITFLNGMNRRKSLDYV